MAGGGFFHDYFYGKHSQKDFTEADLPKTRFRLFCEVFKVRRGSMVGLNLLCLLIWLPAAVWTFINIIQLSTLLSQGGESLAALPDLINSYLLVLFPLIAITGPFTVGASRVMRNWARDEHSFVWSDFKDAMRHNLKQALLYSAIDGAFPLIAYLCVYSYMRMAAGSALFYLPMMLILIVFLLWSLAKQLIPPMIVCYTLKFREILKNSFIITLAALPKAIFTKLITLIVPIALILCNLLLPSAAAWLTAIAVALYAVLLLSFNRLVIASYANAVFEKYINPQIEGAQTDIGLQSCRSAHENSENEETT